MAAVGRILVVDDEPEVLAVLAEYFTGHGYAVATAPSGADALSLVRRERPDLILLDLSMPGLDGVEVLKRVHEHDATIGIIMVTANEDVELARRTLQLGAFDYIPKPFDFAHLERAVLTGMMRTSDRVSASPLDQE